MIITELLEDNFIKTYSDQGVYIHGGFPEADYIEAIDPIELHREYIETDIPIPEPEPEPEPQPEPEPEPTDSDYAEVGKILMGVES